MKFLSEKVALVTGGASGMGKAIALALAEHGASVAIGSLLGGSELTHTGGELVYKPGEKELIQTAREIEAAGGKALAAPLDVSDTQSVNEFHAKVISKFSHIDILVNAAGITAEQTVSDHSEELWQRVFEVNTHGCFRTAKLCIGDMVKRKWGRIINIASTAASVGASTSAAYCASKAAVVGLTRCLALEGAPHGVTANSISPGWVETKFGTNWMSHIAETAENRAGDEYIKEVKEGNPQGRLIQANEIAELAVYLCRDKAAAMTMQDLTLSAGSLW